MLSSFLFCNICLASTQPFQTHFNIQHWTTKNGAQVYFVHAPELPTLDIKVAFRAGSSRDSHLPGLADLTSDLLNQGTAHLNANQIANGFANVGAIFNAATDRDMTVISLRSLVQKKYLLPALQLFIKVLGHASFPKAAVQRSKKITLAAIKLQKQSPSTVATQAFFRSLYKNSAYAHPVSGNAHSIPKITRKDLQRFYQRYYVAKNATIALVGDISKNQAIYIANTLTTKLAPGKLAKKLAPIAYNHPKRLNIAYPSTQTYIRIGELGISYTAKDYFPLVVGNYILGGGLVSRLFNTIREKYGLSYGASSYFLPLAAKGPFVIALQTKNSQKAQAIKLTHHVLQTFVRNGPTAKEVAAAKQHIIGGFPLRLSSNVKIANYLVVIGFYQLPLDYLNRYPKKVAAVTAKQIKTAFQQQIKLNRLVVVSVGGKS